MYMIILYFRIVVSMVVLYLGVLSERYGVSMGTLLELVRSNRGPRSLAPSMTPLVVQLPLLVIELVAGTNRREARASASPPYVFA